MTTASQPTAHHAANPSLDLNPLIERLLSSTDDPARLRETVLTAMCRLACVDAGVVLDPHAAPPSEDEAGRSATILASYPPTDAATVPAWVREALRRTPEGRLPDNATVHPLDADALYGQPASRHAVFLPLCAGQGVRHMGLFLLTTRDPAVVAAGTCQLAVTAGLYTLFAAQCATRQALAGAQGLSLAAEVLSVFQAQSRFHAAALALCNEVQVRWQARRVSLGLRQGQGVRLRAMSQTEHVIRKTALVQAIEAAMEECLDQQVEVVYPPSDKDMVVARQAEALAEMHGPTWVVSVPLWVAGNVVGVLTVERAADQPMEVVQADALRLTCNLVAPSLVQLRDNDRWLGAKLAASVRRTAAVIAGPQHTWVKLAALIGAMLLAGMIFGRGADRVSGSFTVEAVHRRLVTAPFDGYLEAVHVQPGDPVAAGGLLADLETAELRLQAAQLEADRLHFLKQAGIAQRQGDIAEQQALEAEAAAVAAELDLVNHRIQRARVVSPIAGIVLEGDHRRRIGGAVAQADVLFEITPAGAYEARLYVPESRIAEVETGDRGELAAAARPGRFVHFVVERIEPAAIVRDGQNVFCLHARLEQTPPWLRPGMEGVAKVEVGRRSYLWLWTRDAVNWLRMRMWW